ncbi:DNA-binding SARP family transcriptional activator [Nocardioides albertanoniae]|uniref:DNA-binding SARP family transcriptional activator n=1 Tax=Nocardioides albertanoniae TaxID=1175486 RepID=A0A543A487_9ACTN|nr:BTAD domain-containing putative transcriptional regulator [Nocardioides albertanoniae]TQL67405.1 DNA-binding SARP family transcriptional activator [Nocardioides albertanoniae]
MDFQVLGPVRIVADGRRLPGPAPIRQGLLSVLLARANAPVATDLLLDAIWGDHPREVSLQRLQVTVHRLRKSLDVPDRLTHTDGHYVLRVEDGELDSDRFLELVRSASTTADPAERAALLRSALALWRGTPFQGVDLGELWSHAQLLTERRQMALEELYAAELDCGRHLEVVADLADAARRHPLQERLQALLMTALHRAGRQAEALEVYHAARRHLLDELGLEPGPELQRTERRILLGEDAEVAPRPQAPLLRPAQLPAPPGELVGRRPERDVLDGVLAEVPGMTARLVLLTGTAGVGKTALATSWAHEHREDFPDGQLYVDLRGFSPDDPVPAFTALAGFLVALGERRTTLPPDLSERAALFRTLTHDRRLVIMLDNALAADQVRPLLPGGTSCFVIVTSRGALSGLSTSQGAHRLDLGPLSEDESLALLRSSLAPDLADTGAAARLVEHCAGLPLALRVAAERLHGQHRPGIAQLVAELDAERSHLDLLETGDVHTSIRGVLSWSYQRLSPDAARLFRLCGFRCRHPHHYLDAQQAAALLDAPGLGGMRGLLDELVRFGLARRAAPDRYALHSLLQAYAEDLANLHDDKAASHDRLLGYWLDTIARAASLIHPVEAVRRSIPGQSGRAAALDMCATALRWLDARRSELLCIADFGIPEYPIDLSLMLWPYLDLGRHDDIAGHLHASAREAARSLGDREAEGIIVRSLGVRELRLGRLDAAGELLREALRIHDDHPEAALRATTTAFLAETLAASGRASEAYAAADSVSDAHRSGSIDVSSLTLLPLARAYYLGGRAHDAARWLTEAHEVAQRQRHRPVQVRALLELAAVHHSRGRTSAALVCSRQAAVLAEEHGIETPECATGLEACLDAVVPPPRSRTTDESALKVPSATL